jgi:hypothetical protein
VQTGPKALERIIHLDQREEYIHFVRIVKNNKNRGKDRMKDKTERTRKRKRKKARLRN